MTSQMEFLPQDVEMRGLIEKQNKFKGEEGGEVLFKVRVESGADEKYVLRGGMKGAEDVGDLEWMVTVSRDEAKEILEYYDGAESEEKVMESVVSSSEELLREKLLEGDEKIVVTNKEEFGQIRKEEKGVWIGVEDGVTKKMVVDELTEILDPVEEGKEMLEVGTFLTMVNSEDVLEQVAKEWSLTPRDKKSILKRMLELQVRIGDKEEQVSVEHMLEERGKAQAVMMIEAIEKVIKRDGFIKVDKDLMLVAGEAEDVGKMFKDLLLLFDGTGKVDKDRFEDLSLVVVDEWVNQEKKQLFEDIAKEKEVWLSEMEEIKEVGVGDDDFEEEFGKRMVEIERKMKLGRLKDKWSEIMKDEGVEEAMIGVLESLRGPALKDEDEYNRKVGKSIDNLVHRVQDWVEEDLREEVREDVKKRIERFDAVEETEKILVKIDGNIKEKSVLVREWREIIRRLMFERGVDAINALDILESKRKDKGLAIKLVKVMENLAGESDWKNVDEPSGISFARKVVELMQESLELGEEKLLSRERVRIKKVLRAKISG